MMYEVEQKFRVDDLVHVELILQELKSSLGGAVLQSDTYLSHPARDFGKTDEALRLRKDGVSSFITYKGPRIDPLTKTRREIELMLPDGTQFWIQFSELLTLLGFEVVADIKKLRQKAMVAWQGTTIEVALDNVDQLGMFVELEIIAEESDLDTARQKIASLAKRLGLTRNERRSYCEMLLSR